MRKSSHWHWEDASEFRRRSIKNQPAASFVRITVSPSAALVSRTNRRQSLDNRCRPATKKLKIGEETPSGEAENDKTNDEWMARNRTLKMRNMGSLKIDDGTSTSNSVSPSVMQGARHLQTFLGIIRSFRLFGETIVIEEERVDAAERPRGLTLSPCT